MSKCKKGLEIENVSSNTAPFNKKKWRERKYSNKAKLHRWEAIKRKQAERQYFKECKKLNVKIKPKLENSYKSNSDCSFKEAQSHYKLLLQKNKKKKEQQEIIRKERFEAIKTYKEKKAAKFKKISQKTKKGQPLMKGRIELLLEKIQNHYINNGR